MKKHTPALLTIFLFSFNLLQAQLTEYEIKAVFLERFTRFIEWPEGSTVNDKTKPFVIGVFGKNPFNSKLEKLYSTQEIKNKKVEILEIDNLDEIDKCHLLYVSRSAKDKLFDILIYTKDRPILTVGDTEGFAEQGIFINLFTVGEKIRFEISEAALRDSIFTVSYRLLKQARIVKSSSKP